MHSRKPPNKKHPEHHSPSPIRLSAPAASPTYIHISKPYPTTNTITITTRGIGTTHRTLTALRRTHTHTALHCTHHDSVVQVPPHGTRQHHALQVAALADHVLHTVVKL